MRSTFLVTLSIIAVFACGGDDTSGPGSGVGGWSQMTSGTTEDLNRVWGTSADDIFAVGRNGTVLHYDGTSWTPMQSGTTEILRGVWGASSSDVFAAGGGRHSALRRNKLELDAGTRGRGKQVPSQ